MAYRPLFGSTRNGQFTPFGNASSTVPFNVNPAPQGGNGAFGAVPGPIGIPNVAGDLAAQYPNLSKTNAAASDAILSKLHGELSPDTIKQIQDAAAQFGVSSGMPGSGLAFNKSLRDIGLTSEQMKEEGIKDYNSIIPTISGTQTVKPETKVDIASLNALNAAAPDPAAAASYAQQLFDKYLATLSKPLSPGTGGGGAGGTGSWHMPLIDAENERLRLGLYGFGQGLGAGV